MLTRINPRTKRRLIILALSLLLVLWASRYVFVPSAAMAPLLNPGELVMVMTTSYDLKMPFTDKIVTALAAPQRGDVVAFINPDGKGQKEILRVIGLPGEQLEVRGRQILINHQPLAESWAVFDNTLSDEQRGSYGPVLITAGHYFLLGDNRDKAHDSRHWFQGKGGYVPRANIDGKAFLLAWSHDPQSNEIVWSRLGLIR